MIGFLEERHIALRYRAQAWVDAADLESDHDARRVVDRLARHELLKACVPSAHGGLRERVELRDLCVLRAVLGYRSSFADTMFAMQGLGSYPVTLAGNDEQRRALLPRVADGSAVCAFAITEPEAGSDVSAITTCARREGDSYVIDGTKCFISNAGVADSYVLFARTSDDRHHGLSAFLLDGNANGLTIQPTELIAPHPIGTMSLAGVRVPASARLADEGAGFSLAMATLDFFRTSVGAAALGMAARALDEARARVRTRRQFGKALADFQATQMALADMAVDVAAARLLVFSAAHRIDTSDGPGTVDAAMAKLYATEAAQRVIDRAVQLFGGQGVVSGCIVERLYREIRALRIYEGTSEIQKLVIGKALLKA
ncbi:MAG TPA: acyl-CoA dehydrogenase family protein [Polyangia bacterium]|nr:acyl-CoA dehydrogenase family protein [Polyangia bacterium]